MQDILYDFMVELVGIRQQMDDIKNMLEMLVIAINEEKDCEKIISCLKVQLRLISDMSADCRILHNQMDEKILDIIHGRI